MFNEHNLLQLRIRYAQHYGHTHSKHEPHILLPVYSLYKTYIVSIFLCVCVCERILYYSLHTMEFILWKDATHHLLLLFSSKLHSPEGMDQLCTIQACSHTHRTSWSRIRGERMIQVSVIGVSNQRNERMVFKPFFVLFHVFFVQLSIFSNNIDTPDITHTHTHREQFEPHEFCCLSSFYITIVPHFTSSFQSSIFENRNLWII